MFRRSIYLFALAVITSLGIATPSSSAESPCPPILDHKFANLMDEPISLCQFRGKVLLIVNTASDSRSFVIRGIARPRFLADQIDRHVAAHKLAEQQSRHQTMRAEFARWLTTYEEVLGTED